MGDGTELPEGVVAYKTFEILGVNLTLDVLEAILDGFHNSKKDEMCHPPLQDFVWGMDHASDDPEAGNRMIRIDGVWEASGAPVHDGDVYDEIGYLQLIKVSDGRANLIGIVNCSTPMWQGCLMSCGRTLSGAWVFLG